MGMRKYRRELARNFMRDAGVGNVNRKMRKERNGVKLWRVALREHLAICKTVKTKEKQNKAKKTNRILRKAAQA